MLYFQISILSYRSLRWWVLCWFYLLAKAGRIHWNRYIKIPWRQAWEVLLVTKVVQLSGLIFLIHLCVLVVHIWLLVNRRLKKELMILSRYIRRLFNKINQAYRTNHKFNQVIINFSSVTSILGWLENLKISQSYMS